ncbi:MAG: NEW3 domain-containing protein [Candidatus Aenigmarchaeota archaeon]|nr:NEW3 domain-containing protein [Candidatus Aenigmarchaeota archaeon]
MSTGSTRKSKIFLVFFLLFLILYFFNVLINVKAIIVGRLRIPPPFGAKLSILIDNEECLETKSYCPGEVVYITNKLENVGSVNLTGNLSTSILNTTNKEIHHENWNIDLSVDEVEYRNTNYTVQYKDERGIYSIVSNFTFDGNLTSSTCKFKVKKGIGILRRFPAWIIDTIPPGRSKVYPSGIQLWLDDACNSTNATLNTTTGIPGQWVFLSPDTLYLTPDTVNSTDLNITIPPLTPEDIYDNGTIFAYADNQIVSVGLNITVSYTDFRLNVTVLNKKVCQGSNVDARVNITKILPPEDVTVNMTYQVVDINGTVYNEKKDYDVLITENETIVTSILSAPTSMGNYRFLTTLSRNLTSVQAYDTFEVISCPLHTTPTGGPGAIGPGKEILPLGKYNLTLNVSDTILTVILGNKTSFIATVNNTGTETVESVKILIEGIPTEWISVFPDINNIFPGEAEKYLVVIDVPSDAEIGVYKLRVKASDEVESNTVVLTLVIGRNPKEIADLLLKELEKIKAEAERALLVEKCLDVTIMKTFYDDADYAIGRGKEEYEHENYEKAVTWFGYAMPMLERVVYKVDIALEMELKTSNSSKILIPPFFDPEEQFRLAGNYLTEKNYEKICDPIQRIRRFILVGLIFWPLIVIMSIILVIMFIIYYRIKRRSERERILMEAKERIEKIPPVEE